MPIVANYGSAPLAQLGLLAGEGLREQQLTQQGTESILRSLGLGAQMFGQQQQIKAQREAQERSLSQQRELQAQQEANLRERQQTQNEFTLQRDQVEHELQLDREAERFSNEYFQTYGTRPPRANRQTQQRIAALETSIGQIRAQVASGTMTAALGQAHENQLNQELLPLVASQQIHEMRERAQLTRDRRRLLTSQVYAVPLADGTTLDLFWSGQGNPMVLTPRPATGTGTQRDPFAYPRVTAADIATRTRQLTEQYYRPDANGNMAWAPGWSEAVVPVRAREDAIRDGLIAMGQWGNSAPARALGEIVANTRGSMGLQRTGRWPALRNSLERMERILNLNRGGLDFIRNPDHQEEFLNLAATIRRLSPEAFEAIGRINVFGGPTAGQQQGQQQQQQQVGPSGATSPGLPTTDTSASDLWLPTMPTESVPVTDAFPEDLPAREPVDPVVARRFQELWAERERATPGQLSAMRAFLLMNEAYASQIGVREYHRRLGWLTSRLGSNGEAAAVLRDFPIP